MSETASIYHILRTSDFLSEDTDLWLCSRFDNLHMFNILALQDRLSSLETKLIQGHSKEEPASNQCVNPADVGLLADICDTVKAYGPEILPYLHRIGVNS
jgi:hypothetical protein